MFEQLDCKHALMDIPVLYALSYTWTVHCKNELTNILVKMTTTTKYVRPYTGGSGMSHTFNLSVLTNIANQDDLLYPPKWVHLGDVTRCLMRSNL